VARMGGGEKCLQSFSWEARKKRLLEDLDVGGRITLSWTLGRQRSIGQTGFGWLRIESNGGLL
jgi:hypothetical protein